MTDQTPARAMERNTLAAGSTVKVEGIPFVLARDTALDGHPANWAALAARPAGAPTPQAAEPVAWGVFEHATGTMVAHAREKEDAEQWIVSSRAEYAAARSVAPRFVLAGLARIDAAPPLPAAAPEDAAGLGALLAQSRALSRMLHENADSIIAASSRAQQGAPVAMPDEVASAIQQWLDYGTEQWGKSHQGYFSGDGWAARTLRDFLAGQQAGRAARSDDAVGAPPVEPSREPLGVSPSGPGSTLQPPAAASASIPDAEKPTRKEDTLVYWHDVANGRGHEWDEK